MNPFDALMTEIRSRPGDPRGREALQPSVVKKQREASGARVHLMEDDEPPLQVAAPAPQEEPMAYEPRGKVGTLVDAMRADIGRIWTSAEAAKVMDVSQGALSAHLDPAIRHGTLHRKLENGRCQYSLRPFLPPPPPAPAPQEPRIPEFRKDFKADQLPPQHGDETLAPVVKPDTRMSWPPASTPAPSASPAPDPEPKALEETEEVAFNAALWADGDLVIYGAQENDDGSVTLSTEKVRKLCRLLHGQGPEA